MIETARVNMKIIAAVLSAILLVPPVFADSWVWQKVKDRETQDCADIYDWVWDGKGKASVPKPSDPPEG
ncbi:MAG: hypothetical protein LBL71_00780 [Endomicrobium sp.]|jgi:hypothetical protein|nr:hypothetical protein [Endomicrobium sp.]